MNTLRAYYRLTKPGIVYGNVLAGAGGFLLAARGHAHLLTFVAAMVGLALVIASACVFNNYIDRGIDMIMARTKRRPLVSGQISGPAALVYGTLLGIAGAGLLVAGANPLAAVLALAGWVLYVAVYGYFKRHSVYSTEVGSLSGAVPPVVGYAAASGRLDLGAALLFIILVVWQMPHFFAIATFRRDDYAAAGLPVRPVRRGFAATRRYIIAYVVAFLVAAPLLSVFGYAGRVTFVVSVLIGLRWLWLATRPAGAGGEAVWARRLFKFSLIILLVLCLMWSVDALLP